MLFLPCILKSRKSSIIWYDSTDHVTWLLIIAGGRTTNSEDDWASFKCSLWLSGIPGVKVCLLWGKKPWEYKLTQIKAWSVWTWLLPFSKCMSTNIFYQEQINHNISPLWAGPSDCPSTLHPVLIITETYHQSSSCCTQCFLLFKIISCCYLHLLHLVVVFTCWFSSKIPQSNGRCLYDEWDTQNPVEFYYMEQSTLI